MEYLPFGETLVDEHVNSNNSPFKFNGKEYDEETGNYYYSARYYDPKLSIFISVDPLVEKTMDAYAYCYQNPVRFVDPTGMAPVGGGDPPLGLRLGFNFGIGRNGINYNVTASVGVQHLSPNFQLVGFASASLYGGQQLGTSSMTRGIQFDLTVGGYATYGSGRGSAYNFYTLNYNTASPFSNNFDSSVTYGQARTFNSAINASCDGPGWQTQGIIGLRLGDNFSISSNNDANSYGTSLLFKDMGSDAGWTGGIVANIGGIEFGYQSFSGYWPEFGSEGTEFGYNFTATNRSNGNGHYNESLNRAFNFVRKDNVTGGAFSGAWFQNFIHKTFLMMVLICIIIREI